MTIEQNFSAAVGQHLCLSDPYKEDALPEKFPAPIGDNGTLPSLVTISGRGLEILGRDDLDEKLAKHTGDPRSREITELQNARALIEALMTTDPGRLGNRRGSNANGVSKGYHGA